VLFEAFQFGNPFGRRNSLRTDQLLKGQNDFAIQTAAVGLGSFSKLLGKGFGRFLIVMFLLEFQHGAVTEPCQKNTSRSRRRTPGGCRSESTLSRKIADSLTISAQSVPDGGPLYGT
jgi:hypothetical protein